MVNIWYIRVEEVGGFVYIRLVVEMICFYIEIESRERFRLRGWGININVSW